jgi:hypothetical protein
VPFYSTWYSGVNTVADVALVDTNTAFGGNDFALDLVCLTAGGGCAVGAPVGGTGTVTGGVPEASTWALMLLGFASLGYVGYRRAREPRGA